MKQPPKKVERKPTIVKGAAYKAGGSVKKSASGSSLGMKSVTAGVDNNKKVTRADIIAAKTGEAKGGGKMGKCRGGC